VTPPIRPRPHLEGFERPGQGWPSRHDVLRLDMNEAVPGVDPDFFALVVDQLSPAVLSAYPEVDPLYDALVTSLGVSREQLVLTSGSDAGIRQVVEAFCEPGTAMVITDPTYGMYPVYAHLYGLGCVRVPFSASFSIATEDLCAAIGPDTSIVCIANPNGAIGVAHDVAQIEAVIERAAAHGALVLLDEAHIDFGEDVWASRVDELGNVVIVRTFSKAAGLAGLRLGYVLSNERVREGVYAVKPVVEVNAIAALAGRLALEHPDFRRRHVEQTREGRGWLAAQLEERGYEVRERSANFLLVRFGADHPQVMSALAERGILVREHGDHPLLGPYARVTAGPIDSMRHMVDAVDSAVSPAGSRSH